MSEVHDVISIERVKAALFQVNKDIEKKKKSQWSGFPNRQKIFTSLGKAVLDRRKVIEESKTKAYS
eukprot:snap_masked-scaffold_93-processed-gene-0.15-mRNA-1 protein AED:1.00 eAED:1.00 QI:0/0/0/0/1/1/2/0/65